MTAYLSPNLIGVSTLEPVEVKPDRDRRERTGAQVASDVIGVGRGYGLNIGWSGCVVGQGGPVGCPRVAVPSYAVYREMSRQPTLALAIAAANAPVKLTEWSWQSGKKAPRRALNLIRDMVDPMRSSLVGSMLTAREFGHRGFEKVFNRAGDKLLKFKPLLPELTAIRCDRRTGAFAGLTNYGGGDTGKVELDADKSLLYTRGDDTDLRGFALHNNSVQAWSFWKATCDSAFSVRRKISGVIVQLHYPPGESEVAGGKRVDNATIAQQVLDNVGRTNSVAMPNEWAANSSAIGGESGKPQWLLSVVDAGTGGEALSALRDDAKYWDVLMLRGWLVPERAVTEGQFGTKAEAEVHGDILLAVAAEEANQIAQTVNWYVIDQLLALLYGDKARGTVWVEPQPLQDQARKDVKELVMGLITGNPDFQTDVRRQVQMKAAFEKLGFPLNDAVDIDKDVAARAAAGTLSPTVPGQSAGAAGVPQDGVPAGDLTPEEIALANSVADEG